MKKNLLLVLITILVSSQSSAQSRTVESPMAVSHLALINLRIGAISSTRILPYPGLGQDGSRQGDCLLLVTDLVDYVQRDVQLEIAEKLRVSDSRGELKLEKRTSARGGEYLVFPLEDLGKFVTTLTITTTTGRPLEEVVQEVLGNRGDLAALQVVSGCKI
jgi:hypothetical protein